MYKGRSAWPTPSPAFAPPPYTPSPGGLGAWGHGYMPWPGPFDGGGGGGCGVDVAIGAASPVGAGIVASITQAEQAGALNEEDGAEVYKAVKATSGGSGKWWIDVGAGVIGGYILGKIF